VSRFDSSTAPGENSEGGDITEPARKKYQPILKTGVGRYVKPEVGKRLQMVVKSR
jgi:hypothetical protein